MPLVKDPVINIKSTTIRSLSLHSLELDVVVSVENPNLIGATLKDLPFTVFAKSSDGEHKVASGNAGRVVIKGRSSTTITVPVTTHNAGILKAAVACIAKGGVEVVISGTAIVHIGLLSKTVPFSKSIHVTTQQLADALTGSGKKPS